MKRYNKNNIPTAMIEYFFCTGKDIQGKKFRIQSASLFHIQCINAYSNKIVWVKLDNGQRIKLY
jgi:hypothetical protein